MDESQFKEEKYKNGQKTTSFKGVNGIDRKTVFEDFVKEALKTQGIVDTLSVDTNWHDKFARFGYYDPYNALTGCREYIFFTRPDLNLLNESGKLTKSEDKEPIEWDLNNNEYLSEMNERYPYLLEQWTNTKGPFMNMITNAARSTLELPGATSKDVETAGNIYGSKITYRGTSWSSDEQFDFNVEFQDNKYLEMYHLFKIYDEYERLKAIGQVAPKSIYRKNRVLHDQFTAFKMVVGPDGRELIYWGRATGCFPTSFPRDAFSNMTDMLTDSLKFSVSFRAHFARDLNPSILAHFNALSLSNAPIKKSSYSIKDDMPFNIRDFGEGDSTIYGTNINGNWAARPLVVKTYTNYSSHKPKYRYDLIWLEL